MGLIKSYSRFVEKVGIIRTTMAPIRLTRKQLAKLALAQCCRDALFRTTTIYYSMTESWARTAENVGIMRATLASIRLTRWQLVKLVLAQLWRDAGLVSRVFSLLLAVVVTAVLLDRWTRPKSLKFLGIPIGGSSSGSKMDFQTMLEDCQSRVRWLYQI